MPMAESKTTEAECIPFSSIPHTTSLFLDYLHHFDKVSRFYARSPLNTEWYADQLKRIDYPRERREAVAAVLERQNHEFGAGQKTLDNFQRLRDGAPVIVTGQQVTLLGGPVFCILKALTAILQAEPAGGVPVFWLATEDHDLAKVSSVNLPASDHSQHFSVNVPPTGGSPVDLIV